MELYETQKNFIFVNGSVALFCDRLSGHLSFGEADKIINEWNPVCLGEVKGIIGKIKFFPDGDSKLMLITQTKKTGEIPCLGPMYKITKVTIISLSTLPLTNLDIDLCRKHHFGIKKTERIITSPDSQKPLLRSFHEQVKKTAESVKPKSKDIRGRDRFEKRMLEEYEKMFQEGGDNFYISGGFPSHHQSSVSSSRDSINSASPSEPVADNNNNNNNKSQIWDITSNIQRQRSAYYKVGEPLWRRADSRYFWNRAMLNEAIEGAEQLLTQMFGRDWVEQAVSAAGATAATSATTTNSTHSIQSDEKRVHLLTVIHQLEQMLMPVVQGYVDVQPFQLQVPGLSPIRRNMPNLPPRPDTIHEYSICISLISRRNRHRAGTRYRRRGADENGYVSNSVETEQILKVDNDKSPHMVSFVQLRGSVPLFWSQTSLRYHPPIILEKSEEDNQSAFQKHFEDILQVYDKVVVVNLVDTTFGKAERKIAEAYLSHLIKYNSPNLNCIMFDFHDYCRNLLFENVSILLKGITEIFRDMKYNWVDKNGVICEQKSIFRVNCIDCLDRTNVVQSMFAGVVMETQMRKLGLLSPDESLPGEFYGILQRMWANNGDALSRQYSGTAAMKGDFTRTGTRTVNGLVKDGMSSVNRYYLRLREFSRQAAIDLMIGNDMSTEVISLRSGRSDTEQKIMKQKEKNIKELTAQCRIACIQNEEECLTEAILIMCNENEKEFQDMNTVALVTTQMLYFVSNLLLLPESRIEYQQQRYRPIAIALPLRILKKIQLGFDNFLFRTRQPMIRIFYEVPKCKSSPQMTKNSDPDGKSVFSSVGSNSGGQSFLAFKQPNLRLFNNMLLEVKRPDDQYESLKAIAESFYISAKSINDKVEYEESMGKFEKIKNEPVPPELQLQVNINLLYENVTLASVLQEDFDYTGFEPGETCLAGEPADDACATDDEVVVLGQTDKSGSGSGINEKPVDVNSGASRSNIESIKQGFRNVKDKVRIREWKDRFTAPLIKLRKTEDTELEDKEESKTKPDGYAESNKLNDGKMLSDLSHPVFDEDGNQNKKNYLNLYKGSKSPLIALGNRIKGNFGPSRMRFGSSSDDEGQRRVEMPKRSMVKAKSDLFKFQNVDLKDSSHSTSPVARTKKSADTKSGQLEENKLNLIELNNINDGITDDSLLSVGNLKLLMAHKRQISADNLLNLSSQSEKYRFELSDKHNRTRWNFVPSCGLLIIPRFCGCRSRRKIQHQSRKRESVAILALTSDVYQRRAERISLQLSVDDSSVTASASPVAVNDTITTRSGNRHTGSLDGELLEYGMKTIEDETSSEENLGDDETEQRHITTTASVPHGQKMALQFQNKEQRKNSESFRYFQIPPVEVQDQKLMERLVTKQINLVKSVEDLRRNILGEYTVLETGMIIF